MLSNVAELGRDVTELPDGWNSVCVADALARSRGETVRKLQTAEYLDRGALPIIDQGAKFICGYTDDLAAAYPYDLPVIVFGDHTRTLKYVDFPFAVGADGTQCLHSTVDFDDRFFFYSLQNIDLRGEGYARHFKLLKEQTIACPPLDEQRRIAGVLRSVDEAIAAADAVVMQADEAFEALLADLSSRYGEASAKLESYCVAGGLQTGPFGSQLKADDYVEEGVPVIMPIDLTSKGMDFVGAKKAPFAKSRELARHLLQPGDVLFARRGEIGRCGLYLEGDPVALCGTGCLRARLDTAKIDAALAYFLIQSRQARDWLCAHAVGATMPNLNTAIIGDLPMPNIPKDEQSGWVDALLMIEGSRRIDQRTLASLQQTKVMLMSDLLSGRVRVPA